MSILQSVWNGPFYVGKLTQPVSVGDVLLKILEVLWRGTIAIVVIIACVAGGIAAYVSYIGPALFPPPRDSIRAKAFYAADMQTPPPMVKTVTGATSLYPSMDELEAEPCPKDFPVRISLFNEGNTPLTNLRFDLEGFLPGFSGNRVATEWGGISDELILSPNRGVSTCYKVDTRYATPPKDLTYKVIVWSASEVEQ